MGTGGGAAGEKNTFQEFGVRWFAYVGKQT